MESLIEQATSPGHPSRHAQGRRGCLVAVVGGDADDVHLQQLAHHRGELEERLEAPVVLVGVAGICGQELGAAIDLVAHGRHLVVIAAGAEEADQLPGGRVAVDAATDVAPQLHLGREGSRHVQGPREAQVRRDGSVQVVDRGGAEFVEHRFALSRLRVGDVWMGERRWLMTHRGLPRGWMCPSGT